MPAYQSVIFDLDGTLLDTLQDLTDSVNYSLTFHGFPTRSREEIRRFVGNGMRRLVERAVPEGTSAELMCRCLADFRAHYLFNMENTTAPYPGIPQLLDQLAARGIQMAVVSNKIDGAVKGLCQTYFENRIPVAIGESEGIARKPSPDTVYRAMEELHADRKSTVYVGDSDIDLETAANAGLPCVSVSWGFRDTGFLIEHDASVIVDTPQQLLTQLLGQE